MASKEHFSVDSQWAIERRNRYRQWGEDSFSYEQKIAINVATRSALAVIQGRAGSGKSTMLAAVRESYERKALRYKASHWQGWQRRIFKKNQG